MRVSRSRRNRRDPNFSQLRDGERSLARELNGPLEPGVAIGRINRGALDQGHGRLREMQAGVALFEPAARADPGIGEAAHAGVTETPDTRCEGTTGSKRAKAAWVGWPSRQARPKGRSGCRPLGLLNQWSTAASVPTAGKGLSSVAPRAPPPRPGLAEQICCDDPRNQAEQHMEEGRHLHGIDLGHAIGAGVPGADDIIVEQPGGDTDGHAGPDIFMREHPGEDDGDDTIDRGQPHGQGDAQFPGRAQGLAL